MTKGQKLAEMAKQAAYNQKLEQAYEAGIQYAVAQIEKQAGLGSIAGRIKKIPAGLKEIYNLIKNPANAKNIEGLDIARLWGKPSGQRTGTDVVKTLLGSKQNLAKYAPELATVGAGTAAGGMAGHKIMGALKPEPEPEGIAAILAGLRKKLGMD